jgi:hypothetical protein
MWIFHQTGQLYHNDTFVAKGWAGQGQWQNDPASQCVHGKGPLPRGKYTIQAPHDSPHVGKYAMNLIPDPSNNMCGRSDFRIHGAAYVHPELSSEGCIVQRRPIREQIWNSGDHALTVV